MSELPHLLVVDDHREIRDALAKYLARHDYRVSTADSAAAARRVLETSRIELVVLDVMMPREDGFSLCRQLRAKGDLPIIMLTAMAEETDRVVGLELGADDYVTKPFNPRELLARIRAVLRRAHSLPPQPERPAVQQLRFDRWMFDVARRELVGEDGVAVPLSTGEFLLLSALVQRPGMVLTRDQLLDLTRGREAAIFDRSIDNQVSRLRKKIEADPRRPQLIKTHWGGGYSFTAEVRRAVRRLWPRSLAGQLVLIVLVAAAGRPAPEPARSSPTSAAWRSAPPIASRCWRAPRAWCGCSRRPRRRCTSASSRPAAAPWSGSTATEPARWTPRRRLAPPQPASPVSSSVCSAAMADGRCWRTSPDERPRRQPDRLRSRGRGQRTPAVLAAPAAPPATLVLAVQLADGSWLNAQTFPQRRARLGAAEPGHAGADGGPGGRWAWCWPCAASPGR